MDREKAILIFHFNNDFTSAFHCLVTNLNPLNIKAENYNGQMVNFYITPSPRKREVTIQTKRSLDKRGNIKPSILDYLLIKVSRQLVKKMRGKTKTIICKEKNVYFINLKFKPLKNIPGLSEYNQFEIFYSPNHIIEALDYINSHF